LAERYASTSAQAKVDIVVIIAILQHAETAKIVILLPVIVFGAAK
tara:strand:- start:804 stop:938 length:135 start_codon:yes stop_codon:yes gene_type:complete